MPPRINSRYVLGGLFRDTDNFVFTASREPFRFQSDQGNILHVVGLGDTLQNLADRFFGGVNSARLWWVIADFQPEPILDPTEELEVGSILIIPSDTFVQTRILGAVDPPSPKIV